MYTSLRGWYSNMQGLIRTTFPNEFTSGFSTKDNIEDVTSGEIFLSNEYPNDKSKQDFIEIFDVESACIAKMDEFIEKGQVHFSFLFSYRSCGRVCTQVSIRIQYPHNNKRSRLKITP